MGMLSLVLGLVGGMCGVIGAFVAFGVLPTFIEAEEAIGPIAATTAFMWGLAVLLLLGSIACGMGGGGGTSSDY